MNGKKLTPHQTIEFIEKTLKTEDKSFSFELNSKSHSFIGFKNFEKIFELKLPLPFPAILDDEKIESYLSRINHPVESYTVILIQAGHSALGYFEDGEVVHHKVIQAYMTRKKQGKNELTYMNSRGKSRSAGSQLRYQNAIHFFEEINGKLNEWNRITHSKRIFYSCPVKMWHYLFDSNVKCSFDKKDSRLQKIPFDVNTPKFEEMMRINKQISFGYLTFYKQNLDENLSTIPFFLSFDLKIP